MAKRKYGEPVHWRDITRTLKMFGLMEGDGKAEALRISKLLAEQCRKGKAEKVGRGLYREIKS